MKSNVCMQNRKIHFFHQLLLIIFLEAFQIILIFSILRNMISAIIGKMIYLIEHTWEYYNNHNIPNPAGALPGSIVKEYYLSSFLNHILNPK